MRSPAAEPGAAAGAVVALEVLDGGEDGLCARPDEVAAETPVALVYNGVPHAVMMATPADLEDFALGFSVTEDIIAHAGELASLDVRSTVTGTGVDALELWMRIPPARATALESRRRGLEGRTGCGLCGAESLQAALRPPRRVPAGRPLEAGALGRALGALRRRQPLNERTGATHAAAFAGCDGSLLAVREDVGRHNALDKLGGLLLRERTATSEGALVLTSRASYEMVLKASILGIPVVIALSAPTALAVRIAEEAGITLIAFARPERFVVYASPARLGLARADAQAQDSPA